MQSSTPRSLDTRAARRNFARAAATYADAAFVQREVQSRLYERLPADSRPQVIVDLGAGDGHGTRVLRRRFPGSLVIAADSARPMLARLTSWMRRFDRVQTDMHALALIDGAADWVVSNLCLQWAEQPAQVYRELARLLGPQGRLWLTTFGPGTLAELRAASLAVDGRPHVHEFADVQALGDGLLRAGLSNPVIDVDWIRVPYPDVRTVLADLKAIGATNVATDRRRGLHGRRWLAELTAAYEQLRQPDGLPVTYEVVYATAGAPDPNRIERPAANGPVTVPLSRIGRIKR